MGGGWLRECVVHRNNENNGYVSKSFGKAYGSGSERSEEESVLSFIKRSMQRCATVY